MKPIRISTQRDIPAPADHVYALLADYQTHHPRILPPAFSSYRVEEGGAGEGTVIGFDLTVGGRRRSYRQRVTEPQPGRMLTETDLGTGATTTFTVIPDEDGSQVAITTEFTGKPGLGGLLERLAAPRLLGRLYTEELARLEQYARSR